MKCWVQSNSDMVDAKAWGFQHFPAGFHLIIFLMTTFFVRLCLPARSCGSATVIAAPLVMRGRFPAPGAGCFLHSRFLSTPWGALDLTDLHLVLRSGWEGAELNNAE